MMSRELIIQRFCIDYNVKEGSEEFNNITAFADEVKSTEILRKVLDSSNHPATDSGRKPRPNIAMLRDLLLKFASERADAKRQEERSVADSEEECFYCTAGHVLEIYERGEFLYTRIKGRCKCRRGGQAGYLARSIPVEPSQEIQGYARQHKMICARAADAMVAARNQSLIPAERKEKNRVVGKGRSIGEIIPQDDDVPF